MILRTIQIIAQRIWNCNSTSPEAMWRKGAPFTPGRRSCLYRFTSTDITIFINSSNKGQRDTQTNIRNSLKEGLQMLCFHQLCLCLALNSLFHFAELYRASKDKTPTARAAALQKSPLLLSFSMIPTYFFSSKTNSWQRSPGLVLLLYKLPGKLS